MRLSQFNNSLDTIYNLETEQPSCMHMKAKIKGLITRTSLWDSKNPFNLSHRFLF